MESLVGFCRFRTASRGVLGCQPGFAVLSGRLICLGIRGVYDLTDCTAVDPCPATVEATSATCHELVSTLKSQVVPMDTEVTAKPTQLSNLKVHVKMAEGGMFLMSDASCELKTKFADAKAAHPTALSALRSAKAQLEILRALETLLREEVVRFLSDDSVSTMNVRFLFLAVLSLVTIRIALVSTIVPLARTSIISVLSMIRS